jgi:hypothetical protein
VTRVARLHPTPWDLDLSPAMEALLGIVRKELEAGGAGSAGAAATMRAHPAADPAELATLAARHGIEGLVLRGGGRLEGASALTAVAGNLERIRELHRVVAVMEAAGIPTTAMKGPALAVQAWGDVSARSYGDVDLLVPPERARDTVAALLAAGYVDRRARYGLEPSPAHWHDWSFTAPDGRTLVEIHWSLVAPARYPGVDSAEVWQAGAREEVTLPGGTVWALAPEVQLPYLAIHATAHHWGWLEFPLTLAGLVRRAGSTLDWEALRDRARRWRCRRITTVGLLLARELAGGDTLDLPPAVRRALDADAEAARLARWYGTMLLGERASGAGADSGPGPDSGAGSAWYQGSPALWWRRMRMEDTAPARLRAGWVLLFGTTTAEWEATPAPSRVPAPVRRMLRLLRKHRGEG